MIYLDWASTSPPESAILSEAAALAVSAYGNPSSRHGLGTEARAALEDARARFARSIAAPKGAIVFTGGGSEADAIPLLSLLRSALNARRDGTIKRSHLVTSSFEHSAVYEQARLLESLGLSVSFLDPEPDGRLSPSRVAEAIRKETAMVAVMAVNNETGAVQDLAAIARAVAQAAAALGRPPVRFHADAVQALGKIPFEPASLGISSAAFSAHKLRGPRGIGALWTAAPIEPLALGGGQEGGMRPGTESLQGAWAFARAAERALERMELGRREALSLEARLIAGLGSIPDALPLPLGRRAGAPAYSPFILSAAFPGLSGEVLARSLADSGIAVSTGAACSSNQRKKGRRVLEAMGLPQELAFSSIRISIGETTTAADIDAFLEAAAALYAELKS